jgi:hypothetical protein
MFHAPANTNNQTPGKSLLRMVLLLNAKTVCLGSQAALPSNYSRTATIGGKAEILQLNAVDALEYQGDDTSYQSPFPIFVDLFMQLAASGRVCRAAVYQH